MGAKGTKGSAAGQVAAETLVDDLQALGEITAKKMFGGFGVFLDGTMFAIVDSTGGCYLRSDPTSASRFEERGATRHARMPYWQIPESVRADEETLLSWAQESLAAARAAR